MGKGGGNPREKFFFPSNDGWGSKREKGPWPGFRRGAPNHGEGGGGQKRKRGGLGGAPFIALDEESDSTKGKKGEKKNFFFGDNPFGKFD